MIQLNGSNNKNMPPSISQPNVNERSFEKVFIILLFIITVTQFSTFGYQSVRNILGSLFNVQTVSTPVDSIIGLSAMIASALVFAGGAMWWKEMTQALKFISIGAIIFMVKNVLDIINEVILFKMSHAIIGVEEINQLAKILGNQFFQLAFWILVFFYFRYAINKRLPQN